jgi:predicted Fe-Mo cluster-binding NifX family protein
MPETMPTHRCIFCPKSHSRLAPAEPQRLFSDKPRYSEIRRIAVPIFNGRVSPVIDTCTQLYMLESDGRQFVANRTVPMKGASIFERAGEIKKLGIQLIICGAVGEAFYNLLKEADIDLVYGITGDIDEVIDAYRNGVLSHVRFRMPGFD